MMLLHSFLFLLLAAAPSAGPDWKTFDDAARIAKQENKKIMVSFYAVWCKYCKQMDQETFTDKRVLQAFKKNFVVVHLNVESDETLTYAGRQVTARQFSKMMRASALPTTSFLDSDAKPITYLPGKPTTDIFLDLLEFIGTNAYLNQEFDAFVEKKKSR